MYVSFLSLCRHLQQIPVMTFFLVATFQCCWKRAIRLSRCDCEQAYPYCPDALQIFNLLAEETNAPSAEELLMFGQIQQGSSLSHSVGNSPRHGVAV